MTDAKILLLLGQFYCAKLRLFDKTIKIFLEGGSKYLF